MRSRRAPGSRLVRWSAVAGAVVAVLVMIGGAAYGLTRPAQWTAEAQAVVLPDRDLDPQTSAGYYETLSRGQIPATFAEVLGEATYLRQAEDELGVAAGEREAVHLSAVVVPNTALVSVSVTAPRARLAERLADRVVSSAAFGTDQLARPYVMSQVSSARGTADRDGLTGLQYVLLAVFLGLVAGVVVQQLVLQVGQARARARGADAAAGAGSSSTWYGPNGLANGTVPAPEDPPTEPHVLRRHN